MSTLEQPKLMAATAAAAIQHLRPFIVILRSIKTPDTRPPAEEFNFCLEWVKLLLELPLDELPENSNEVAHCWTETLHCFDPKTPFNHKGMRKEALIRIRWFTKGLLCTIDEKKISFRLAMIIMQAIVHKLSGQETSASLPWMLGFFGSHTQRIETENMAKSGVEWWSVVLGIWQIFRVWILQTRPTYLKAELSNLVATAEFQNSAAAGWLKGCIGHLSDVHVHHWARAQREQLNASQKIYDMSPKRQAQLKKFRLLIEQQEKESKWEPLKQEQQGQLPPRKTWSQQQQEKLQQEEEQRQKWQQWRQWQQQQDLEKRWQEVVGGEIPQDMDALKRLYKAACMKLHPDRHPKEQEKYTKLFKELGKVYVQMTKLLQQREEEQARLARDAAEQARLAREGMRTSQPASNVSMFECVPPTGTSFADLADRKRKRPAEESN